MEDVKRLESASKVELKVNGAPLGVSHSTSEVVEVPALNDFKVTKTWVEQGTNQVVIVQFSDPLSESQNLEGLITMSELPDLDFEIKGNEVRVPRSAGRLAEAHRTSRHSKHSQLQDARRSEFDVEFERLSPAVRFTGKGSILPGTDGLVLPFEAVNLKAVDVKVVKIFESDITVPTSKQPRWQFRIASCWSPHRPEDGVAREFRCRRPRTLESF